MALIRCPKCDTLHDLEGSFFAAGARKVRCATCREIWEAADPETSFAIPLIIPKLDPTRRQAAAAPPPEPPPPAAESADISAAELEALFAEAEPAPENRPIGPGAGTPELPAAPAVDIVAPAPAAAPEPDRRANRHDTRRAAGDARSKRPAARSGTTASTAVALFAAGIGTLATLGILRNETVRLFPQTAPIFEAVGFSVGVILLDIDDVRSRLVKDDGRETLEVTGVITNLTRTPQKIPVMRLAIRSSAGQEIYVWTATADLPELRPGEKTSFRRRLASPPEESHSVMVRFVAKDDIVAAIR